MKYNAITTILYLLISFVACTNYHRNKSDHVDQILSNSASYYSHKALALADSGKYDQAIQTIYKAVFIRPLDPEIYLNLGSIHYYAGDLDSAIYHYQHAIRLRPTFPMALSNISRVYFKMGNHEKALDMANKAITQDPDYADAWVIKSEIYMANAMYDEAGNMLQQQVKAHPENNRLHQQLGQFYHQTGLLDEATNEYLVSLHLYPDNPQVLFNLGNVFFQQCRLEDACTVYKSAIEKQPDMIETLNNYGLVLTGLGLYDKAEQTLLKALEKAPESPTILFNLSIIMERTSQYNNALEYINQAIHYDSTRAVFFVHQGNIHKKLDQSPQAVVSLEKALGLNDQSINALNNFGSLLMTENRVQEASLAFEKTIQLFQTTTFDMNALQKRDESMDMVIGWCNNPDNIFLEYSLLYLNLGKSLLLLNQTEKALEALQNAAEIYPGSPDVHESMALAWYKLNKPELGQQELALAAIYKGDAFYQNDQPDAAKEMYLEAQNTSPSLPLALVKLALVNSTTDSPTGTGNIDQIIQAHPNSPELLAAASEYYLLDHQPAKAESLLNISASLKTPALPVLERFVQYFKDQNVPEKADLYQAKIHYRYGLALAFANLNDAAINEIRKSIKLDPQNIQATLSLADLYMNKQLLERAESTYHKALNISPDNVQALLGIATALGNQGQYPKALKHLENAIKLEPDNARVHYTLAVNYYFLEDKEKSRYHIKKAESLGMKVNSELLNKLQTTE